jgi:mycofactocin glycosyltransferase
MDISLIIPTCNRRESLRRTLASLERLAPAPQEVIVVDDASDDGTSDMVAAAFPHVTLLRRSTRGGPAAARNQGVRAARGELIAFTDDDSIPPVDWLARHAAYYSDPRVGAVGGPSIPPRPNFFDKFDMARDLSFYFGEPRRIESITGWEGLGTGNMTVRRSLFDQVGYFDEAFLTGADPEFSRRVVRLGGHTLILDPGIVVDHLKVHNWRSYLRMRFHRGCGAILTDIKEGSLSLRHFLPIPHVMRAWREWQHFRERFDSTPLDLVRYWALVFLFRWSTVAGRAYYLFKVGRGYEQPSK